MPGFYSKDKGGEEAPAHEPVYNIVTGGLLRTHGTCGQGVKWRIFIMQKEICVRSLENM